MAPKADAEGGRYTARATPHTYAVYLAHRATPLYFVPAPCHRHLPPTAKTTRLTPPPNRLSSPAALHFSYLPACRHLQPYAHARMYQCRLPCLARTCTLILALGLFLLLRACCLAGLPLALSLIGILNSANSAHSRHLP